MDYRALFDGIHRRPSMYGLDGSYAQFCVFVEGVDAGNEGRLLTGFRELLVTRKGGGDNLVWRALVLHLAFPGGSQPAAWPTDSPEANRAAVELLFALLAEYLDRAAEHDGLTKIYDDYLTWRRDRDEALAPPGPPADL